MTGRLRDLCDPPPPEMLPRLALRLPRESPLRGLLAALPAQVRKSSEMAREMVMLLRDSSGERWREQEVAARLVPLLQLDLKQRMEACAGLIELLERHHWTGESRTGPRLFWGFVALAFTGRILVELFRPGQMVAANEVILAGCGIISAPLLHSAVRSDDAGLWQVRRASAASLGWLKVPGAVDGLAEAATGIGPTFRAYQRETLRLIGISALYRVLPKLKEDHFGLLKSHTVPALTRLLERSFDEELRLIILEALGKIGDGRALAAVAYVSDNGTPTERACAARILPILRERRRKERDPRLLLRAAAESEDTRDLLLRPAESSQHDEGVLLRPSA